MRTLIVETKEIKELPEIVIVNNDLVKNTVKTVKHPFEAGYEYEMLQENYNWWCEVQQGIEIAKENGIDTMDYEDYRKLCYGVTEVFDKDGNGENQIYFTNHKKAKEYASSLSKNHNLTRREIKDHCIEIDVFKKLDDTEYEYINSCEVVYYDDKFCKC